MGLAWLWGSEATCTQAAHLAMLKVVCLSVVVRGRDGGLAQNFLNASPAEQNKQAVMHGGLGKLFLWKRTQVHMGVLYHINLKMAIHTH